MPTRMSASRPASPAATCSSAWATTSPSACAASSAFTGAAGPREMVRDGHRRLGARAPAAAAWVPSQLAARELHAPQLERGDLTHHGAGVLGGGGLRERRASWSSSAALADCRTRTRCTPCAFICVTMLSVPPIAEGSTSPSAASYQPSTDRSSAASRACATSVRSVSLTASVEVRGCASNWISRDSDLDVRDSLLHVPDCRLVRQFLNIRRGVRPAPDRRHNIRPPTHGRPATPPGS